MMPHFFIIGAMKCATSTLHEQLAAQPGIFMSTPKEPNFFSDDDVHARGIYWYESLFADAPDDALCGESSTHYTKLPTHPHTIDRLAAALPEPKLIYVMRHPIDRLVSHYIHAWTTKETSSPIDKAIDELPELVDYGRYAMQLAPWIERFGHEAVLPVFLPRMRAEPQEQLSRIGRFIGMSHVPTWRNDVEAQNVSSKRLRESPARDFITNLPGVTSLRRKLVPRTVRDRIKKAWTMDRRPELSPRPRQRATEIFDEDLATLGHWLDADLTCDTFDELTRTRPLDWKETPAAAA